MRTEASSRSGLEKSGERRIPVDTINGHNAALSPYATLLTGLGFDADRGTLTLWS